VTSVRGDDAYRERVSLKKKINQSCGAGRIKANIWKVKKNTIILLSLLPCRGATGRTIRGGGE